MDTNEVVNGATLIARERARQIAVEGWTPEHDDDQDGAELVQAAICYARQAAGRRWIFDEDPLAYADDEPPMASDWPWDSEWWKPKNPIADLVRAGALIAAEIDRLQRAAVRPSQGDGGGWGSVGNGMLTVSSTAHCRAYLGLVDGLPRNEGECDHLAMPNDGFLFQPNTVYWVDGACVHESLPVNEPTRRQFVRLSMPSNGPWFEGYTKNPTGIPPRAEILPARTEFMAV